MRGQNSAKPPWQGRPIDIESGKFSLYPFLDNVVGMMYTYFTMKWVKVVKNGAQIDYVLW